MKVDRRSFLALGVGGAAGTALSPLPWKLTDDLSIWSQRWPWVPVPEDGEIHFEKSTCTLCPGGCGIDVRMINDRPVKIEGQKRHPINRGGTCLLGAAGLQFLYGPSRVRSPLQRVGKRGQGKWAPISWDAALAIVSKKLTALRADGRPQALACIAGKNRGTVPALLKRFLKAYGSPNFIGPSSASDSLESAANLMTGHTGPVGFDLEAADYVVSFGCGLLDGWGSPVHTFQAVSHRGQRGAELVQIDFRLSNTAAAADRWVPVNPGTESVLALGMAHVIIADSLYDPGFVTEFASGFDAFKHLVMTHYPLDTVAGITGVSVAAIKELATRFGQAKRPLALFGRGRGLTAGTLSEAMAIVALNALTGRINREGGLWLLPDASGGQWPELPMDAVAAKGFGALRLDGVKNDAIGIRSLPARFFKSISDGSADGPDILLAAGANPAYTQHDTAAVQKALAGIPFIVSFSSFFDETTQQADLILPNHTFLERFEDVPAPAGFHRPYVGLTRPVVSPQHDTRHLGDTVMALARRLKGPVGAAFQWQDYHACLQETMAGRWRDMAADGHWMDTAFSPSSWKDAFKTGSGRFEFNGGSPSPALWQAVSLDAGGKSGDFPLLLVPYDSMRLSSGNIANPPFVTKIVADTVLVHSDIFVAVNPETAGQYKLGEGSAAVLSTPKGQAAVRIHLSERIKPGILAMPTGLGHTAFDDYLAGKGVNVNQLIGPMEDPVSGFDAAWGIRAKVTAA